MPCTMNYENAKWTILRTQDDSEQPIWVMLSSEQLARKDQAKIYHSPKMYVNIYIL